jgi:hypothetical protein
LLSALKGILWLAEVRMRGCGAVVSVEEGLADLLRRQYFWSAIESRNVQRFMRIPARTVFRSPMLGFALGIALLSFLKVAIVLVSIARSPILPRVSRFPQCLVGGTCNARSTCIQE